MTDPPRPRWRLFPRTLGGRLVAGVVALVIVIVAGVGGATYGALSPFLTHRLNQQLGAVADSNLHFVQRCVDSGLGDCTLFNSGPGAAQKYWLSVLTPQGVPLSIESRSAELKIMELSPAQRAAILSSPSADRKLTTTDGASLRVTARAFQSTSGVYLEIVGLSTADDNNTLHRLLLIELLIGAGAVFLACAATSVGVRLSLRPLHRVTNTARAVTAELSPEGAGLDRRVDVDARDLDTEVGRLASAVNTLLGAVETQFAARLVSEQRMRQFMADASHELRTPLTSIRGYAELARMRRALEGNRGPALADTDADALDRIESEGTRMSRLVEDLLTLARGDTGAPLPAVPVELAQTVEAAVQGARAAYPQRHFEVNTGPATTVNGDHDQLLRIIRNLVTNAAVHTAPPGSIAVNTAREGSSVVIRVIDAGPGLAPEQAAHVFERFWRSDSSRARSSGGTGLGLAIVASIVAAHGGSIRFDSSVATGSTVTVSLPAQ